MPLVEILVPERQVARLRACNRLSQEAINIIERRINELLNMNPIAGDFQSMYLYELASWVYVAIEAGVGESVESILVNMNWNTLNLLPFG